MKTLKYIFGALFLSAFVNTMMGQQIEQDPSLSILPPSPTSTAFAEYAEFPVNLYSGSASINIPLASLTGRSIGLPISLSYHASGVKVNDIAGSAGLGWVVNSGGVISRTVMGLPDEDINGYINKGQFIPDATEISTSLTNLKHFASDPSVTPWDGQPDVFNVNLPGFNAKFFIDTGGEVRLIPHQDADIVPTIVSNKIVSFKVTTPDGMQYTLGGLGATETSTTNGYNVQGSSSNCRVPFYTTPVETSWYLTEMYNPRTKDDISFTYLPKTVNYDLSYNESIQIPTGGLNTCSQVAIMSKCVTTKQDNGVYISEITSSNGKVGFTYENRTDVVGDNRIKEVVIKGTDNSTLKSFEMKYTTVTSSGTTPSTSSFANKRLFLDTLLEKSSTGQVINRRGFTYEDRASLPPRLSYKQDHWGYFNDNPVSGSIYVEPIQEAQIKQLLPSFTNADREPSETKAHLGTLKQVKYPTGGTANFEYESNTVGFCDTKDVVAPTTASAVAVYNNGAVTTTSTMVIDYDQVVSVNYDVYQIGVLHNAAYVEILKVGASQAAFGRANYEDNALVAPICYNATQNIFLTAGTYTVKAAAISADYTVSDLCSSYHPSEENATITVSYNDLVSTYYENLISGGIRVKKTIYSDEDGDNSNDIIKKYVYNQDSAGCNKSTGRELGKRPTYFNKGMSVVPVQGTECDYNYCPYSVFSSSSISSIVNHSGAIVGYEYVTEEHGETAENGYVVNKFNIQLDGSSIQGPNAYDFFLGTPTIDFSYKSGQLLKQTTYNTDDKIVGEVINQYKFDETLNKTIGEAINARHLYTTPCESTIGLETEKFAVEWYSVVSEWFYLESTTSRVYDSDGFENYVETIESYNYDVVNGDHTFPTSITKTNSDGKIHVQNFKYAFDETGLEYTALETQNIIQTPVEATTSVAGVVVDGYKTEFSLLGSTPQYPYPVKSFRYEGTFNNGVFTATGSNAGWEEIWEVSYDLSIGLAIEFTRNGWVDPEEYSWDNRGLIEEKTFIDHTNSYEYFPNQSLIVRVTDIDKQYVDYIYDEHQRLSKVFARPKVYQSTRPSQPSQSNYNVVEEIDYVYYNSSQSSPINFIESTTSFTPVTGSDLQEIGVRTYIDGLGRQIAQVKIEHSPNLKDVIIYQEYDNQGRISKIYEPFESTASDGSLVALPIGQKYAEIQYFDSPNNRKKSETPPDFPYPSNFTYSSNAASVSIAGTSYGAGELIVNEVEDGNGNKTQSFVDKIGRTLQIVKPLSNITQTLYDDKNRVEKILPPGTSLSDTDLIYSYEYDGADNITSKKIPDQADVVKFVYDDRDLNISMQDPEMRSDGRWISNNFDAYGRVTSTGFINSASTPIAPYNIDLLLTTTSYFNGSSSTGAVGKVNETTTRILGSSDFLKNKSRYDEFGRLDLIRGNNHLNVAAYNIFSASQNAEQSFYSYDFGDNLIEEDRTHKLPSQTFYKQYQNRYDEKGRLEQHYCDIGTSTITSNTLVNQMVYDFEDQLIQTRIGSNSSTPLQTVDFTYNEQGWLTGINPTQNGDLFTQSIAYQSPQNYAGAEYPDFAGNISQIIWQIDGLDEKAYNYQYDNLYRIKNADFLNTNGSSIDDYSASYSYDSRGNISSLNRRGKFQNGSWVSGTIDSLDYTYSIGTNMIKQVTDLVSPIVSCAQDITVNQNVSTGIFEASGTIYASGDVLSTDNVTMQAGSSVKMEAGFKASSNGGVFVAQSGTCSSILKEVNGFIESGLTTDYTYDENGNLEYDSDKEITIIYNHLNLPDTIKKASGDLIVFRYSATGMKLQRTTTIGTTSSTYDYINGIEYYNGEIEAAYGNGYRIVNIENGNGTVDWEYEYHISDHLGNTRVAFIDSSGFAVKTQVNDYYPFGMKMYSEQSIMKVSTNRYLYNNKELIGDLDIGLYDYGARFYDPSVGRWGQVDPMAEKYASITPYAYVANMPTIAIDPDGNDIIIVINGHSDQAIQDLGKVYATRQGRRLINRLARSNTTYYIDGSASTIKKAGYNRATNTVKYSQETEYADGVQNPSYIALGHELYHADQDEKRPWMLKDIFFSSKDDTEREAMRFENYLRNVFSQGPHRKEYGGETLLSSYSAFDSFGEKVDVNSVSVSTFIFGGSNEESSEGGIERDNINNGTEIMSTMRRVLQYMDQNGIQRLDINLNQDKPTEIKP